MKTIRCAIYTRKSSEEGLEQAFNSLDAQREACAAYILSQASEGWSALPDIYDDGGLSGGSLERPALQRLLTEVAAGRVDIIVVYKVDRLTRSLLDFSKLVEAFDAANTSFVSVTQSFNTTTSMGRLTLNMLLSFAQFEREVTAERIRDKIAASKAKGMWMGGTPPLGYKPNGRSLAVVEPHADLVRDIFARYLRLGNVRLVADELQAERVYAPVRTTTAGRSFGGIAFSRGQIYSMLKCPIYIGEIHHHGAIHQGLHDGIVDRAIWDQVQAGLAERLQGHRRGTRSASPSLFAGKIVDSAGQPLIATHACKGRTRYRYYVSRDLHAGMSATGMRIPAGEIEGAVSMRVAALFEDGLALAATAWLHAAPGDIPLLVKRCAMIAVAAGQPRAEMLRQVVQQVRVHERRIAIDCDTGALAQIVGVDRHDDAPAVVTLVSELRLTRSGMAMRLVQNNGTSITRVPNRSLIKLLLNARRWWTILRTGEVDMKTLAQREAVNPSYVARVLRVAFLAPVIVDATLKGASLPGLGCDALIATGAIELSWSKQILTMLPSHK